MKIRSKVIIFMLVCVLLIPTVVFGASAPKQVSKIKASVVNNSYVNVTWNKVSCKGYCIYRSTSKTKGFVLLKTITSSKIKSFKDVTLKANKKYYYKVRSYNLKGKKKLYSKYSKVSSGAVIKTATVSSFKASAVTSNSVKFAFASTCNSKYQIFRKESTSKSYTLIATTSGKTYVDSKVSSNKKYFYYVKPVTIIGTKKYYGKSSSLITVTTSKSKTDYYREYTALYRLINLTTDMNKWNIANDIAALNENKTSFRNTIDAKLATLKYIKYNFDYITEATYRSTVSSYTSQISSLESMMAIYALDTSYSGRTSYNNAKAERDALKNTLDTYQKDHGTHETRVALENSYNTYAKKIDGQIKTLQDELVNQASMYVESCALIDDRTANGLEGKLKSYVLSNRYDVDAIKIWNEGVLVINTYKVSIETLVNQLKVKSGIN